MITMSLRQSISDMQVDVILTRKTENIGERQMKKNEAGFSLIEMLVVVIIIAIVAAIAIPNLLASRRAANQATAISNLRTVSSAQATYSSTTGGGGYALTFDALSATAGGDLLDDSWTASPVKNGYTFALSAATSAGYCVTATRTGVASGDFSYAISHQNVIYQLAGAVAPTCANDTGIISTGTVVGAS